MSRQDDQGIALVVVTMTISLLAALVGALTLAVMTDTAIAANYRGERLVDGTSGNLTHTGESHGVSLASNGWAIYIGRADFRTDAERGAMIGQASSP